MAIAEANGQQLYYEILGEGEPLFCVAGLSCDTLVWIPQIQAFSAEHRTVIFDNRDVGQSSMAEAGYSIADMASYPWIVPYERQGQKLDDFPHLKRWFEAIKARPATLRAYEKAKEINPNMGGIRTAEERAILFGQTAASVQAAVR